MQLRYATAEVASLNGVASERKCSLIGLQRAVPTASPAKQVSPRGVIEMVGFQVAGRSQFLDQSQALVNSIAHRDSNSMIQIDNRRAICSCQFPVECRYLLPVGLISSLSFGVHRSNGSLHLIRPGSAKAQRLFHQFQAFVDLPAMPQGPILF